MPAATNLSHIVRFDSDPKVLETGPSSLTSGDRLARYLGYVSIGLGLAEVLAPKTLARWLGMDGRDGLIRGYGLRELGAAVPTLSIDKQVGLAARIAGDALDIATLVAALRPSNPKRGNVALALGAVAVVTILDITAATTVIAERRKGPTPRDTRDRSGFPQGKSAARGAARRSFQQPADMTAEGQVAAALPGGRQPADIAA